MSVEFKELLIFYITITGFISYIPLVVRMIKRKSSEDVSISTWCIWLMNSSIYLIYLGLSSENIWLLVSSGVEVSLILITLVTVVTLRIYKRRKR